MYPVPEQGQEPEPCQTGTVHARTVCKRGGIGCPLHHDDYGGWKRAADRQRVLVEALEQIDGLEDRENLTLGGMMDKAHRIARAALEEVRDG